MSYEKVVNAWHQAEIDLQIKINAPFVLPAEVNIILPPCFHVEKFGSITGTIVFCYPSGLTMNAEYLAGWYNSQINCDRYSIYDRELFMETLNDWGYYGEESIKPDWYTGFFYTA